MKSLRKQNKNKPKGEHCDAEGLGHQFDTDIHTYQEAIRKGTIERQGSKDPHASTNTKIPPKTHTKCCTRAAPAAVCTATAQLQSTSTPLLPHLTSTTLPHPACFIPSFTPPRPDPTRPDPTRPDPTRPDPTRPDPTLPLPHLPPPLPLLQASGFLTVRSLTVPTLKAVYPAMAPWTAFCASCMQ